MPQDIEPLRKGLHHPVLDAVVNHFDEVARPTRTRMDIAMLGTLVATLGTGVRATEPSPGDRAEKIGSSRSTTTGFSADHHAIAAFQAPHPTAGPDIQIEKCRAPAAPRLAGCRP